MCLYSRFLFALSIGLGVNLWISHIFISYLEIHLNLLINNEILFLFLSHVIN